MLDLTSQKILGLLSRLTGLYPRMPPLEGATLSNYIIKCVTWSKVRHSTGCTGEEIGVDNLDRRFPLTLDGVSSKGFHI